MASEVDALLERLVAQFASPYDFLRELVQNSMDAGADRVEVSLEMHPAQGEDPDPDAVVFELAVVDTGAGMDEGIIDGELTRLFGTSKEGDRSVAGGFGIGFVSVFAWDPERVLLQTGRAGEGWELLFHQDRQFEKVPIDQPVEGTAIHLFRAGRASERVAMAEAVRDALWRWCRFAPLEVTFEDLAADHGPELVQDSPEPEAGELALAWAEGDTRILVAFDVPEHAVLLRHGLVLEEGGPRQLLTTLADTMPQTLSHLRVRVDSPRLRTTLARDKVVDDQGRAHVEQLVGARIVELREKLVARLEAIAQLTAQPTAQRWDHAHHRDYAYLHAHLALERDALGPGLNQRSVLRVADGAATPASLVGRRSPGGICVRAAPGEPSPAVAVAMEAGLAVVVADADDLAWLQPLLQSVGLRSVGVGDGLTRVEPASDAEALAHDLRRIFAGAKFPLTTVGIGAFVDPEDPRAPLWGLQLRAPEGHRPAVVAFDVQWREADGAQAVWLNREHPAVAAAMRLRVDNARLAAASVALILGAVARGDGQRDMSDLAAAVDELLEAAR